MVWSIRCPKASKSSWSFFFDPTISGETPSHRHLTQYCSFGYNRARILAEVLDLPDEGVERAFLGNGGHLPFQVNRGSVVFATRNEEFNWMLINCDKGEDVVRSVYLLSRPLME